LVEVPVIHHPTLRDHVHLLRIMLEGWGVRGEKKRKGGERGGGKKVEKGEESGEGGRKRRRGRREKMIWLRFQ
jgi:hypothetical protein